MKYTHIRVKKTTHERLKTLLAKYIGKVGRPVSMVDFMELLVKRAGQG